MKFRCSSNDLLSALQVAIRALSVRSPQPILEGVLIEALDDEVRLTASDGTFTIITTLPAAVEDEGDAVMPGRLFNEVVRKMPSGEVSANLSHSYVLSLRCLGSRTNISGQNADAYPRVEVSANDAHIELPQSLVKDMITRTSFAVPMEDQRQGLTGGFFNMQNGQIDMVGLDGFRMAMRTARVSDTEHTVKAIIPLKSLEEIAKLMADDEESRVEMRFGNNQLFVKLGSTRLITSLIDGEYIDYRRVIPKSFNTELTVGREEFARCVDRASLMAREGKNNRIKFTVEGEKLFITSNSEIGDVFEEMSVKNSGSDIVIAFNVKYMMELIRVVSGDEMTVKFGTPVSPCVIAPVSGDDYTYLVLPVRLNA